MQQGLAPNQKFGDTLATGHYSPSSGNCAHTSGDQEHIAPWHIKKDRKQVLKVTEIRFSLSVVIRT